MYMHGEEGTGRERIRDSVGDQRRANQLATLPDKLVLSLSLPVASETPRRVASATTAQSRWD